MFAVRQYLSQGNLELIFDYSITAAPMCSISRQSSTKRGQPPGLQATARGRNRAGVYLVQIVQLCETPASIFHLISDGTNQGQPYDNKEKEQSNDSQGRDPSFDP